MEIELARELIQLFFLAPGTNGILVFEDNDYLGVILKRDVEMGLSEGTFQLFENINTIRAAQLPQVLFKKGEGKNCKVPVVDKAGKLQRILSHDEFLCQFDFESYKGHFKPQSVLDDLDHPFIITNFFKKTIYANKQALALAGKDFIGKSFTPVLKSFHLRLEGPEMFLIRNDETFRLCISRSESKNFATWVYQILPVPVSPEA